MACHSNAESWPESSKQRIVRGWLEIAAAGGKTGGGVTQQEYARMRGVPRSTLQKWIAAYGAANG